MTDKLLCPFCNKPLQPTFRQSDEYWCENYDCSGTNIEWVGSKKLWQSLINERQHATDCQDLFIEAIAQKLETETELERTKKQLEIANDTLRHVAWFFDGDYNVYTKDMNKEIKYAIKAISDIADYGQPITKGGDNE